MKTVKIPECMNPFEVIVNNQRYKYPGGTTQEVPDEVAEVIEVHMKNHADMTAPPYVPGGGGGYSTCKVHVSFHPMGENSAYLIYSTLDSNGKPASAKLSYAAEFDDISGEVTYPDQSEYDIEVLCGSHIVAAESNLSGITFNTDLTRHPLAGSYCLFVPEGKTSSSITLSF